MYEEKLKVSISEEVWGADIPPSVDNEGCQYPFALSKGSLRADAEARSSKGP